MTIIMHCLFLVILCSSFYQDPHLKCFRGGTSPASSASMSSVSAKNYFLVPKLISRKSQILFLKSAKSYILKVPKIIS